MQEFIDDYLDGGTSNRRMESQPVKGAVSSYLQERKLIRGLKEGLENCETDLSLSEKQVRVIVDHKVLDLSPEKVAEALEILTSEGLNSCLLFIQSTNK